LIWSAAGLEFLIPVVRRVAPNDVIRLKPFVDEIVGQALRDPRWPEEATTVLQGVLSAAFGLKVASRHRKRSTVCSKASLSRLRRECLDPLLGDGVVDLGHAASADAQHPIEHPNPGHHRTAIP
jgi:hypothetical protein